MSSSGTANSHPDTSLTGLLANFVRRRGAGWLVIVVAVVGYLLGGLVFLPHLGNSSNRSEYKDFFINAAVVVSAIFVTLAVSSREVTSSDLLGIAAPLLVGTGALASVVILLPFVSLTVYSVAFIALVGGGIAGLVATMMIAAVGLFAARADREAATLQALEVLAEKMTREAFRGGGSTNR